MLLFLCFCNYEYFLCGEEVYLNRIAIWFVATSFFAVILMIIVGHFVIDKQPTIVIADYSGTSEEWDIDLCIIDNGNTIIEVSPNNSFDLSKTIYLDVQSPDGSTYTIAMHYDNEENCYRYKHPTSTSVFNNVVDLVFTIKYDDVSNQVELHRDSVVYYLEDYEKNDS